MDKYYFFLVKQPLVNGNIGQPSFILAHPMYRNVQTGYYVFFVDPQKAQICPFAYQIQEVDKTSNSVTLRLAQRYEHGVQIEDFINELVQNKQKWLGEKNLPNNFSDPEAFINRLQQSSIWRESMPQLIDACIFLMGGKLQTEQGMLQAIQQYITACGYYFPEETLYNYHICLKTRPFVILAGLSGTGKSKLTQLYAAALGCDSEDYYMRLPVRPNWNDDRYVLGYFNTITEKYIKEPPVNLIIKANRSADCLHFLCLDEMNLAHVEYYFAQFLSALEEDDVKKRYITLMDKELHEQLYQGEQEASVPEKIFLSPNLLITGTINVDETTQPISDKVIDRANTIEFFKVELDKIPDPQPLPEPYSLSAHDWLSYRASAPDKSYRPKIIAISEVLLEAEMGFGYRVMHEIEMYLANSHNLLNLDTAFDLQVKQRILPRVRGTEIIGQTLDKLSNLLQSYNLPRSVERLDEMKKRLTRDGYTSFWH